MPKLLNLFILLNGHVQCKDRLHRVETSNKFRNKSDRLGDGGRVRVIGIE